MQPGEKVKPEENTGNEDAVVQPNEETLHRTDPQDHMEGPISSLVQSVNENHDEEEKKEEEKKDNEEEEKQNDSPD